MVDLVHPQKSRYIIRGIESSINTDDYDNVHEFCTEINLEEQRIKDEKNALKAYEYYSNLFSYTFLIKQTISEEIVRSI